MRCGSPLAECVGTDQQRAVEQYTEWMDFGLPHEGEALPMDVPGQVPDPLLSAFPDLNWEQRRQILE